MISTNLVFNVTQKRAWKGDRRFRVWVADGAFRGSLLHENGVVEGTGHFVSGIVPLFDIAGIVILIVLLPVALLWGALIERKERRKKEQLDALLPGSNDYLAWDEPNFRLRASDIQSAKFFEKTALWTPTNKLELCLCDGQTWKFSLADRQSADQLKRELNEGGIAATWRENG